MTSLIDFSILIADDDSEDQVLFETAIKEINKQIVTTHVYNGLQFLDVLIKSTITPSVRHEKVPDLIIADIYMPFATGLETLQRIRQFPQFNHIPVYIFSTNDSVALIPEAMALGVVAVIKKPHALPALKDLLLPILIKHGAIK